MLILWVGFVNQKHGWIVGGGKTVEEEGKGSVPTLANLRHDPSWQLKSRTNHRHVETLASMGRASYLGSQQDAARR